ADPAGGATDGFTDAPHTRVRRAVAARLTESKQTVPHFYVRGTANVEALIALRAQLNGDTPVKVSFNDLLVKAVAVAHRRHPEMNVIWTHDAVRAFEHVDIAVAIASERGLVTPVLRGVDTMSITQVAEAVRAFAERADAGTLKQRELEGGTVSLSNLGMFGVEEFSAIINPPHASILSVGAIREEPVVREGGLGVGRVLHLVLSVDHRPVDGASAAAWMRTFLSLLERPVQILA
ncbi:MAG: dihydrolipoamide acetyltransferase family protein, partial [Ornithinibacter sp.]